MDAVVLVTPHRPPAFVGRRSDRGLPPSDRRSPAGSGRVRVKVAPAPGVAVAASSPPMARASSREMLKPRPVPPNLRVFEPSACWKGWNSTSVRAGSNPMPVSRTSRRTRPLSPCEITLRATWPSAVNLTALLIRLPRICSSRMRSPRHRNVRRPPPRARARSRCPWPRSSTLGARGEGRSAQRPPGRSRPRGCEAGPPRRERGPARRRAPAAARRRSSR